MQKIIPCLWFDNKAEKAVDFYTSNFKDSRILKTTYYTKEGYEIRIMVNPVVIEKGTLLFAGLKDKLLLKLIKTKPFKSGNALLCYKPL